MEESYQHENIHIPRPQDIVSEIADIGDEARQVYDRVFHGLTEYCSFPHGFLNCKLHAVEMDLDNLPEERMRELLTKPPGGIINPKRPQREAIIFFQLLLDGDPALCYNGDPLRPQIGAYLYGPPGTGKTHIMIAYAIELRQMLDGKLEGLRTYLMREFKNFYRTYLEGSESLPLEGIEKFQIHDLNSGSSAETHKTIDANGNVGMEERVHAETHDEFVQRLIENVHRNYPYKPTDIIFIGFDPLCELYKSEQRRETIEALVRSPVVFIDDMHPKRDPDRETIIQHVIERRYEERRGATFITSNLSDAELVAGDKQISDRLGSRCAECFYTIDFSDCDDWRKIMKSKQIQMIKRRIEASLGKDENK